MGHTLTAEFRRAAESAPAAFQICGISRSKTFGRADVAIIEVAAFFITRTVQWEKLVLAKFCAFFDYRMNEGRRGILIIFECRDFSRIE